MPYYVVLMPVPPAEKDRFGVVGIIKAKKNEDVVNILGGKLLSSNPQLAISLPAALFDKPGNRPETLGYDVESLHFEMKKGIESLLVFAHKVPFLSAASASRCTVPAG